MANAHGKTALMEQFIKTHKKILGNASVEKTSSGERIVVETDATTREARRTFLSELFKKLPQKNIEFFPDARGGSPSGAGAIKVSTSGANPFFIIASKGSTSASKNINFKPKDILGACGAWISPDDLYSKTKKTIEKIIPDPQKKEFLKALRVLCGGDSGSELPSASNGKIVYDGFDMGKETKVPSEVFELFSSITLARLLKAKDTNIKSLFQLGKIKYNSNDVKIFIPLAANFGLVDFFITLDGTSAIPTLQNPQGCLLISVKALVSSKSSNVVSFKDAFQTQQRGHTVYDNYAKTKLAKNKKETIFAKSAVYNTTGKDYTMYPIGSAALFAKNTEALGLLKRKAALVLSSIPNEPSPATIIENACAIMSSKLAPQGILNVAINSHKHSANFGVKASQNPFQLTKDEVKTLENFIDMSYQNAYKTATESKKNIKGSGNYTCAQLSWCLERLFYVSSVKDDTNNMNFFQLFYKTVVCSQRVGYAVTNRHIDANKKAKITMSFYTSANFKTFTTWMFLRSKNAGKTKDALVKQALGMDFAH